MSPPPTIGCCLYREHHRVRSRARLLKLLQIAAKLGTRWNIPSRGTSCSHSEIWLPLVDARTRLLARTPNVLETLDRFRFSRA
jgi:hypothetical protein